MWLSVAIAIAGITTVVQAKYVVVDKLVEIVIGGGEHWIRIVFEIDVNCAGFAAGNLTLQTTSRQTARCKRGRDIRLR